MSADGCKREAGLLDAIVSGTWPEAAGRELRDHVAGCEGCATLALVAGSIAADRRATERHASPRPSGAVWWRMQMRMEREARETAARTVRRAHSAIIATTVVALAALLSATKLLGPAWRWIVASMPATPDLTSLQMPLPSLGLMAVAGLGFIVLTPLIVWLAVAEE